MSQRITLFRMATPAVAILLALTSWMVHRSVVFSRFDPITVNLVDAELYPLQRVVAVALRDVAELHGQTAILEVSFRNLGSQPRQVALLVEGLGRNRVQLPPDTATSWAVVLRPDVLNGPGGDPRRSFEFTGDAAGWAIAGVELRNYYWRHGSAVVILPTPSASYTPATGSTVLSIVLTVLAALIATGRKSARNSIDVAANGLAAAAFLACLAALIAPGLSPYRVLLSPFAFIVITAALFAPALVRVIGLTGSIRRGIAKAGPSWVVHRTTVERGAALFGLVAISVAQPVFDVVSNSPEFFAARGTNPSTLVASVAAMSFGVPLLLLAIERGIRAISPRSAGAWLGIVIAVLVAALIMGWFRRAAWIAPPWDGVVSGVTGLAVACAYSKFGVFRQFFTALAAGAVVVPVLFLVDPDVRQSFLPSQSAAAMPAPEHTPPIVLVIFDELPMNSLLDRTGDVDAVRYPNFAALARDAYWFRNASTVSYDTTHAVPAILSGRYPGVREAVPTLRYYPVNLFTALAQHYDIFASIRFQKLCPQRACQEGAAIAGDTVHALLMDLGLVWLHMVLPESLTEDLPPVAGDWADLAASQETGAGGGRGGVFEHFVSQIDGRPARLYVIHSMLPHMAFEYVPSGRRYRAPDYQTTVYRGRKLFEKVSAAYADTLHQRHLAQVGFVDRLVGNLVAHLRIAGVYDKALVIFTADHGASYREGRSRREPVPQQENLSDILQVPLFVKLPGQQRGERVDRLVETVDILPTILDVLGVKTSLKMDGRSLFDAGADRDPRTFMLREFGAPPRPIGDLSRDRAASLDRKYRRFSAGDFSALYASPDARHLLGTSIDRQPGRTTPDVTITIRNLAGYAAVKRERESLPLYVRGVLRTSRVAPVTIAVAVNGTVEAVAESFLDRRGHIFGTLIPESALREGQNRIEAFVVDGALTSTWEHK